MKTLRRECCAAHTVYVTGCDPCRAARAASRGNVMREVWPPPQPEVENRRLPKDEAACCLATMDAYGRMEPGFCSPECVRRPR